MIEGSVAKNRQGEGSAEGVVVTVEGSEEVICQIKKPIKFIWDGNLFR